MTAYIAIYPEAAAAASAWAHCGGNGAYDVCILQLMDKYFRLLTILAMLHPNIV